MLHAIAASLSMPPPSGYSSTEPLSGDLGVEVEGRAGVAGVGLVGIDVVLELLLLLRKLGRDILALGLLGGKLELGGHELEDLVLGLASSEGVGVGAGSGLDGRVEGLLLSVVGDVVHLAEEVDVGLGDGGRVGGVEVAESGEGLGLCVSSSSARDGDVVEGSGGKDTGLTLGQGSGGGKSRKGQDGDGSEKHFDGCLVVVVVVVGI